jgi:hypothetical protein
MVGKPGTAERTQNPGVGTESPVQRRAYSLHEYSEISGSPLQTVYAHARQGCIPGQVKIGKRYFVAKAVLDQLFPVPASEQQAA